MIGTYVLYAALLSSGKWSWQPVAEFEAPVGTGSLKCMDVAKMYELRVFRCLIKRPDSK